MWGVVLLGIVVILVCMKGWKEKAHELVQRVTDYFDAPRLFLYLFIFFILNLFIFLKYAYSYPFQIDDANAMYFLSALVQSQAAILAIVITLTLIAVQLASSHYSPRVIDIFKKDPAIWRFLCYYGISIFFGLYILIMMQVIQNGNIVIPIGSNRYSFHISLEYWIYAAYLIAIGTFVGLFLYLKNVFDLLKPLTIIKRLSDNITKKNVLEHTNSVITNKKYRTQPIKDDPIQPIMDIIHSSVMKYDIATTRIGLGSVTDRVIEIIKSDGEGDIEISRHVCDRFERVGRLTVNKTDGEATAEVIKYLYSFCETIVKQKRGDVAKPAVESLGLVGRISAENGLEDAASKAAESLGDVGKAAAEKGLEDATNQAARSLGDVGKTAERNGLERAMEQAWESLGQVGKIAAGNRLSGAAASAARDLVFFGGFEIEKGNDSNAEQVICFLEKIGKIAAEKGLDHVTKQAAESLGLLGRDAAEKGKEFENVTNKAIWSLESVGRCTEEWRLDMATKQVAQSFICVGVFAVKNGLDGTAQEAAKSLAELSISYSELFQKFVNLYEQQLE